MQTTREPFVDERGSALLQRLSSTPGGQTEGNQLGAHAIDPVSARIASKVFNQRDDRTVSPTTPWAALRSALRCWSSPSSCPGGFTRFPRGALES